MPALPSVVDELEPCTSRFYFKPQKVLRQAHEAFLLGGA
jgi:hypothetical protein